MNGSILALIMMVPITGAIGFVALSQPIKSDIHSSEIKDIPAQQSFSVEPTVIAFRHFELGDFVIKSEKAIEKKVWICEEWHDTLHGGRVRECGYK